MLFDPHMSDDVMAEKMLEGPLLRMMRSAAEGQSECVPRSAASAACSVCEPIGGRTPRRVGQLGASASALLSITGSKKARRLCHL